MFFVQGLGSVVEAQNAYSYEFMTCSILIGSCIRGSIV